MNVYAGVAACLVHDRFRGFIFYISIALIAFAAFAGGAIFNQLFSGPASLEYRSVESSPGPSTLSKVTFVDAEGRRQELLLQGSTTKLQETTIRIGNAPPTPVPLQPAALAESSAIIVSIYVLGVAFFLASSAAIIVAWSSATAIGCKWPIAFVGPSLIVGVLAVYFDPVGAKVSYDLQLPKQFGASSTIAPLACPPIDSEADPVPAHAGCPTESDDNSPKFRVTGLWLVEAVLGIAGGLAGMTVGAVLAFLYRVLLPSNGSSESVVAWHLWERKRHFQLVISISSVALSLGIAVMSSFFEWGGTLLEEKSQEMLAGMSAAGLALWGGMFTLLTLTTAGITASYLHHDIHTSAVRFAPPPSSEEEKAAPVAEPAAVREPPGAGEQHADRAAGADGVQGAAPLAVTVKAINEWKKNNDLEFDPFKSIATVIAALGPVLTSVLVLALKGSLGG